MRIIRAADCRVMPWKNGQGSTTEIAVHPEGAGLEDFDWRVSMAAVATDGPFSAFSAIDRTLSVLDGAGIGLSVAGRLPTSLTADSEPYAFPGDSSTSASLLGGPITDFNVMSRRGRMAHTVRRLRLDQPFELSSGADFVLLHCHAGAVAIASPQGPAELNAGDSALTEPPLIKPTLSWRITPEGPCDLFCVEFRAAGR